MRRNPRRVTPRILKRAREILQHGPCTARALGEALGGDEEQARNALQILIALGLDVQMHQEGNREVFWLEPAGRRQDG